MLKCIPKVRITILIITIVLSFITAFSLPNSIMNINRQSGNDSLMEHPDKRGKRNPNNTKSGVSNLFFAYDFTLEKKSIKERVIFLDSLGYQGVTFAVNTVNDLFRIDEYQKYILSETNNRLKIPAVFYHHNLESKNNDEVWKQILNKLDGTKTDLWLIISGNSQDVKKREMVIQFLKKISDYADSIHLNVVIYPHHKTYIESASNALPYIKAAARKNLFLSFHLCHELRAGNGNRMNTAIAEVAPFLKLASISGSAIQMQDDSISGWDDAIKPLYKGDYDTRQFLECLIKNGYNGPIALHTFGLKEPIDEHFRKSMEVWKKMCSKVSAQLRNSKKKQ